MKTSKPPKAQENPGDQVEIGVSFEPDWLREWREFFGQDHGANPRVFSKLN